MQNLNKLKVNDTIGPLVFSNFPLFRAQNHLPIDLPFTHLLSFNSPENCNSGV